MRAGPNRYETPKLSEQREKLQAEIKALAGLKEGEKGLMPGRLRSP